MRWALLSILIFYFPAFAKKSAKASAKSICTARELIGQDCRVYSGSYQIRLLTDTIARDDGTWHTVDPMPLKGDGVTWEKVSFVIEHGQPVLQLWLWDKGIGETQVQALRWYVADARQGALKILSDGVVRRRRLKVLEENPADPNVPVANVKPEEKKKLSFLYDGWEKHSVKVLKNRTLEWELGSHKKILEPAKGH
jgi:hypothetical protein